MKKNLITATLMTFATTILLGIIYPLVVTGLAQLMFPKQANGQLIQKDGKSIGSRILGQSFFTRRIPTSPSLLTWLPARHQDSIRILLPRRPNSSCPRSPKCAEPP